MGKYYGEMLRYMADSLILPLDVLSYNKVLEQFLNNLKEGYGEVMKTNGITLGE